MIQVSENSLVYNDLCALKKETMIEYLNLRNVRFGFWWSGKAPQGMQKILDRDVWW